MKKILVLLLVVFTILPLVISCGNVENPTDTTGAEVVTTASAGDETEAQTTPFDVLEKENLGYDFHIYYPSVDKCYTDFYAEAVNGEIQNDAIYARNQAVCDKLGITLSIDWRREDINPVNNEIMKQYNSNEQTYDMFGGHRNTLSLSYGGYLYDLATLQSLSLDEIWWDQNWKNSMTLNGSLYLAAGDISIDTLLYVSSLTFNKKLLGEYGIEAPYALVREGKWTYEKLYQMTLENGQDTDSDGVMTPGKDKYSIIGWHFESGYSMFYGSGFTFLNKDGEGKYKLEYNDEKLNDILTEVCKVWNSQYAYMRHTSGDSEHESLYKIFADGQALFSDIVLVKIGWFYSGMADEFGVLPIPKYSEEQEKYCSYTGFTIPLTCFCRNAENPERTGKIIEAFARASYSMVTPLVYEIVTKTKNVRDAESAEMTEIVYRNKIFDAAHYFNLPTYGTLPLSQIKSNNSSLSTMLKSGKKVAEKEWKKIQDAYDGMSNK